MVQPQTLQPQTEVTAGKIIATNRREVVLTPQVEMWRMPTGTENIEKRTKLLAMSAVKGAAARALRTTSNSSS